MPFDYGTTLRGPTWPLDSGLVYELSTRGYVDFSCTLNYSSTTVATIAWSREYACAESKTNSMGSLNYQSILMAYSTASGSRPP